VRGRQAQIHSSKVRTVVLGLSHIHRQGTYTGKVWAVNAFGVLSRTQVLGCERQAGSDSQQQGAYSRARSESCSQARYVHRQGLGCKCVWSAEPHAGFRKVRGRQAQIHSSKVRTVVLGLSHVHRQGLAYIHLM